MSAAEVECIGASIGEGVDVSSDTKASADEVQEEADATDSSAHERAEEANEAIDTSDRVISVNCDSAARAATDEEESKEVQRLRPILTNGGSSIPRPPRKKSVSFDDVDDSVKKFINGDPIIDKQNPFKHPLRYHRHTNGHRDEEFVTKEEVLKESKFVRTYIKNPDKYFTYDPSVVERLKDETEEHSTRIPTPRKPIPIPRKLSKTTKERLKELTIKYSPPKFYTQDKTPARRANGVEKPRVDRSKYPDLADIKVKTGTDWEHSLYNPEEVAINVKKFDNRFKTAQFGSQDDLDDIAEQTDVDANEESEVPAIESKKSFTNTVNSAEFKEFLKKKGLTLTPETGQSAEEAAINGFVAACEDIDKMESKKKRSMLQRIFNGGLFSSKGKTTPKEPLRAPEEAAKDSAMKRVVLERPNQQHTPTRTSLPANNEFHKVFGGRGVKTPSEEYVDMNQAPSSSKQQVRVKEIHGNYIDMTPKSRKPVVQTVHHVDSSTGANTVLNAQNMYRNIDMAKSKAQPLRLRVPAVKTVEKPPVLRRTPVRQSLQPRPKVEEVMYGNLNRSNSLPRGEPVPLLPQRNTRQGIISNTASPEKAFRGPKSTSTPVEEQQKSQMSSDLSPIVSTSIQVDSSTWMKIKELKDMTDRNLLYSTPKPKPIPVAENIYESTEKLRPTYGRIGGRRSSVENAPVVLVRNSPQRSTIDSVYRNRNLKIVDGQCVNAAEPSSPSTRERSQSVLDGMTTDQEPVVMRKRQPVYLSREEILNKVKEFCRKSMNSTPNKEQRGSPEISPVSYASVDSRRSGRVAPQVPRRVESLPESPIYAPVYRQAMPQVQRTPNPVAVQLAGEQIVDTRPHYQTPPGHLLQVGNQIYAPIRRPIPASLYAADISPYGYLHLRNTVSGIPPKTPRPASVQGNPLQRRPLDGRSTPLVLHSMPRADQVVYSRPQKLFQRPVQLMEARQQSVPYESESGSEAGEIQRILQKKVEEDWQNEKGGSSSGRAQQPEQAADDRRRGGRREDPRRHTLGGGDMMHYGPGQAPPQRTMDLEAPPVRGYTPMNQGPLFDDDPGIMSEVETASTGFRRGGKQRSSLPVVRTPSKTLERPLGLVFLQYRSETKRALLPNEITSIDTVRALFVRSFPRQLTMAYLEGPTVKIYIHDASKDMFYELEDVRSHLREIRDRSVLRLFESNEVQPQHMIPGGPLMPPQMPPLGTLPWEVDQSYFSEPEFDSEYQHQHIHKSKGGKAPYYVGAAQTLPRGMYSDRNKNSVDGYMSSPERGTRTGYEEPYYSQYGTRGGTVTPIIDEEHPDANLTEDQYALYGVKISGRIPRNPNQIYDPTRPEDLHRIRVEHMERQLANLTGLVQKALNQTPQIAPMSNINQPGYLNVPGQCRVPDEIDGHSSSSSTSVQANGTMDDTYIREKPPKLGRTSCHKSVSFEKSVSFSDDIQGVPKSHSPQHPGKSLSCKITAV